MNDDLSHLETGRCDLCNSEDFVQWAWTTPNQVDTQEEAREKQIWWFEDPVWYVCDTCHRIILAESRDALLVRALMCIDDGRLYLAMNEDGEFGRVDMHAHIFNVHDAFWKNKTTHELISED